jgi:diketogulonate reductase-like aldo/keto reductase
LINRPFLGGAMFRKLRDVPLPAAMKPHANTWAQAMLKYILAEDAVTCVIPATSNPKHMADNVQAGSGSMPDAPAREALRAAIAKL